MCRLYVKYIYSHYLYGHTRSPAAQTSRFSYPLEALGWPAARYGIMKEVERETSGEGRLEIGPLYRLPGRLLRDGPLEMRIGDGQRHYYSRNRRGRKFFRP